MKSTVPQAIRVILLLALMPLAGSAAQPLPGDPAEVDGWRERCVSQNEIPTVKELAASDGNPVCVIRAYDLMLQRYMDRRQTGVVFTLLEDAREAFPGTLLDIWAQGWLVYSLEDLGKGKVTQEALAETVRNLPEKASAALEQTVMTYPDNLTGARALRLLDHGSGPGAFGPGGPLTDMASSLESEAPGTSCAAYVAVQRGANNAASGDWEGASRDWLSGLADYPFEDEIPGWRAKLVDALWQAGDEVQARLLPVDLSGEGAGEISRALLKVRRAQDLAQSGAHEEALELLAVAREQAESKAGDDRGWRELLQVIEAQSSEVRMVGGMGSAEDEFLQSLKTVEVDELAQRLSEGLAKHGDNGEFCRTAFEHTKERLNQSENRESQHCWTVLAREATGAIVVRCCAYLNLMNEARRKLSLLRLAARQGSLSMNSASLAVLRSISQQEDNLLKILEETEAIARTASAGTHVLDLVDEIYSTYTIMGIREQSEGLYVHLLSRLPREQWKALAARAERVGQNGQAIAILEALVQPSAGLSSERLASSVPAKRDLLSALLRDGRVTEAAQLARSIVEDSSGAYSISFDCYVAGELSANVRDYANATTMLQRTLATAEDQELVLISQKLLAKVTYRQGDHETALAVAKALEEQGQLDAEEARTWARARAYSLAADQKYEGALSAFREYLQDHNCDGAEVRQIRLAIESLESVVSPNGS